MFLNKLVYIVVIFLLCVKVKLPLSLYNDIIFEENSLLPIKFLSLFTSLVNNVKESKLYGDLSKSFNIRLILLSNKSWDESVLFIILLTILGKTLNLFLALFM